ncbi:MAG: phospholipase [Thermoanaerobaculia bacterium]
MSSGIETSVHRLPVTVHGRFLLRRATDARGLLVGFHGYGENAEALLEALVEVPGVSRWSVVAVQALHPFYNRRSGEVVASWMTKLDRETAIADNVAWVDAVVERARELTGIETPPVFLGFSQGTAMAYRAAARGRHGARGVVSLAGDVPPELAADGLAGFPPVLVGGGSEDARYTDAVQEADVALLESRGVEVESMRFEGGHEWTPGFRRAVGRFLDRLA